MSNSWEELIRNYKSLVESTKDTTIPEKLFSRIILCSVNRDILAATTELDFRLEAMSGHESIDMIENRSLVPVLISLADMAEMESTNPTVGRNSPFYVDNRYVHYIPWGFDVVRDHVGAIARKVNIDPSVGIPVEDLMKFESLLRRFSDITIQFRTHSGRVNNLNYAFSLATGQINSPETDLNIRREVEREVSGECEIVKQLVEVGKMRIEVASGKVDLSTAITATDRINRTFRW